jgi:hypothetical protein
MEKGLAVLEEHGCHLSWIAMHHPGGEQAIGSSMRGGLPSIMTDNELDPPYEKATRWGEFVEFCRYTEVLIHDAQYLQSDMLAQYGWGHSLVQQACQLAVAAEVKQLILFHHDPVRTDAGLDAVQEETRAWMHTRNRHRLCTAAYEGLVVDIEETCQSYSIATM